MYVYILERVGGDRSFLRTEFGREIFINAPSLEEVWTSFLRRYGKWEKIDSIDDDNMRIVVGEGVYHLKRWSPKKYVR